MTDDESAKSKETPWRITSKNLDVIVFAPTRKEALVKFFASINDQMLEKLGQVVLTSQEGDKEEEDEVPFRTVPTLVNMGLMDEEEGAANIAKTVGISEDEASEMLSKLRIKDQWLADRIKKLRKP